MPTTTTIQKQLGPLTLPMTPKAAPTLDDYQQAVSIWTRQVHQVVQRIETTLVNLNTAQIPEAPGGGLFWSQALFDAAFAAKTTDALAEGSVNLYFTTARARLSISATAPVLYDNTTGVISMHVADATHDGYLSSSDWTNFTGKVNRSGDTMTGDLNFTSPALIRGNTVKSLDPTARTLFDVSGVTVSVDWDNRKLHNASGVEVLRWADLVLLDGSGPLGFSVDWGARLLWASDGEQAADWDQRILIDHTGATSLFWDLRALRGAWSLDSGSTFTSGALLITTGLNPLVIGGDGITVGQIAFDNVGGWDINAGIIALDAIPGNEHLSIGNIGLFAQTSLIATSGDISTSLGNFIGNGHLITNLNGSAVTTGTVGPTVGGTGQTTVTTGDLLYGSASNVWSKLADVATGNALISGGVGVAPSWGKIGLTTHISGTLGVGNGGTGVTTFGGTNRLLYTTATDTLSSITTANTSALVTSNTGVPSWTSGGTANRVLRTDGTTITFAQVALATDVSGTLAATNGGTGTATVTTGDLLYGSATNTWSKLADVSTGNALISGGVTTAPSWGKIGLTTHITGTLSVGNGGTGATSFTAGRVLVGNGSSSFTNSAHFTWSEESGGTPSLLKLQTTVTDGGIMLQLDATAAAGQTFIYMTSGSGAQGFLGMRNDGNVFAQCGPANYFQVEAFGGGPGTFFCGNAGIGGAPNDGANSATLLLTNDATYGMEINSCDDTTTPSSPGTPAGYLHFFIDGADAWIPYFR